MVEVLVVLDLDKADGLTKLSTLERNGWSADAIAV
jgi:hypothetical protein